MFSIICIYTNKELMSSCLLNSINKQNYKNYELILIDNSNNKFPSASKALNWAAKRAKGDYLLFIHQDVDLIEPNSLEKISFYLKHLNKIGIIGVVGVLIGKKNRSLRQFNQIEHGIPRVKTWGRIINKPVLIDCVDECLFIIPKDIFDLYPFDDQVIDGWDLYSVDYCYTIKKYNLNVYVLPIKIYHVSDGLKNFRFIKYFITLSKIIKKHHDSYKVISTTIGDWDTKRPIWITAIFNFRSIHLFLQFLMNLLPVYLQLKLHNDLKNIFWKIRLYLHI
ncbi:hypothetical protein LCGC14_1001340 [marine sediment metagenome]|uniref:Streptomycin biosynthesis protein StrF domain-containing protein n=1 Tax=marine sediment metagenome TaxID=412755 RepID=A0A0F9R930_9ZZZZ